MAYFREPNHDHSVVSCPHREAFLRNTKDLRRGGIVYTAILLAGLSLPGLAHAQSQGDPGVPPQQLPTPTAPTTTGGDVESRRAEAAQPDDENAKLKALNRLVLKGWVTSVPTFDDTITQDAGGWRSALASAGFGLSIYSINLGVYDFAQAGGNRSGPQLYNGQKFTYQTGNQTAVITYDLSRIGLAGGQLAAIVAGSTNGYQARDGIRGVRMKGLSWYQPVASGKVELEFGIIANQTDYMGTSVGGSLAGGALGPQASIPVEAGMSYGQYGAPTASARINWTKHLYTRTGIQRSISPSGSTAENAANSSGLRFSVPGAKPLVIQEIGYRVVAAPGERSFWIRGGGLYNTSDYKSFVDGSRHDNRFFYIAADRQLTQPDADRPGRGLYVGATFDAAPSELDLISRYYEARAYDKGPLPGRPDDMASLVAAVSYYGPEGRAANTIGGFAPYSTTQTYTGSYSFKVTHGLYLQPGVSVVVHPVYNRDIGTAVNGLLNLVVFL